MTASFYDEDLAFVHHTGFTEFARRAGHELLQLFQWKNLDQGLVVDLACGSGVWAGLLIEHGYDVVGVDLSKSMIDIARRQAPEAQFYVSTMHEFELPACAAVTVMGEGLNYAMSSPAPSVYLEKLFDLVADRLQPGGLFVFDVIVHDKAHPMQYQSWAKGEGWAVLSEVSEETNRRRLIREVTVFRRIENCYRRSEERHEVHVLDGAEISRLLRNRGFLIEVSDRYGEYELPPRRQVFVAEKAR